MTSAGVTSAPPSSTRIVFCHILPKPWTGPTTRRPVTFRFTASAGTSPSFRVVTFLAQKAASLDASGAASSMVTGSSVVIGVLLRSWRVGVGERLGLAVEDADRLVQAGQLEDLPVVLIQPEGDQPLALAVRPDQQRHQHPDAATVHVLETAEVEDDRAGELAARPRVGVGQGLLGRRGHVALEVDDAGPARQLPDIGDEAALGHCVALPLLDRRVQVETVAVTALSSSA